MSEIDKFQYSSYYTISAIKIVNTNKGEIGSISVMKHKQMLNILQDNDC